MDKLDTKLVDIHFSVMNNKLQKWFKEHNFIIVKDIVGYGINNLVKLKGFGRKSHTTICYRLSELDIHYEDGFSKKEIEETEKRVDSYLFKPNDKGINYLKYEMDISSNADWRNEEFKNLIIEICLHSRRKSVSNFKILFTDCKKEYMLGEDIDINQLKRLYIYLDSIFKMDKIK